VAIAHNPSLRPIVDTVLLNETLHNRTRIVCLIVQEVFQVNLFGVEVLLVDNLSVVFVKEEHHILSDGICFGLKTNLNINLIKNK